MAIARPVTAPAERRTKKYLNCKDIRHAIRHDIDELLRNHEARQDNVLSVEQFAERLARLAGDVLANTPLVVTELAGPAIVVTRDLHDRLLAEKRS